MTSLAFMFDEVPDPVWKTSIGNWSSQPPAATSSAAAWIAAAASVSNTPSCALTDAAAALIRPRAWMTAGSIRWPLIGKFSTARWVVAPHFAPAGTATSPMESCSSLVASSVIGLQ